jgi:ATP-binding cassette subfamily F protein 3
VPVVAVKKTASKSAGNRKNLEARIKRLEEMIARLNAKKAAMEAQLADPEIYRDASKEALETVLRDQAYVGKELVELEGEWLEKQAELEQPAG